MENLKKIDHSAIKTNQGALILLNILAFLLDQPWLVLLVTLVFISGALLRRPGFGFLYKSILKPLGWLRPDIRLDNDEPHLFSQGLGSVFMAGSSLALFLGAPAVGWGLAWIVTGLAALNLFAGFCVGCMIYYWLNRLHVPGFLKSPPAGTFPGMRPDTQVNSQVNHGS